MRLVPPILTRASWRHGLRHPWQLGLSVLGIALGVAVVVSVDVSSTSARRAFDLSMQAVTGRATHQIVGGHSGIRDRTYVRVRRVLGDNAAAPVVQGRVHVVGQMGRSFLLLGIDPFAEGPFRPYAARRVSSSAGVAALLSRANTALLASATAAELGLRDGDAFTVRVGARSIDLSLAGIFSNDDALGREAARDLILVDVATAQVLLGRLGRLTRIDLLISTPAHATLEKIAKLLAPDERVVAAAGRSNVTAQMTRSFELNLFMLSLLALLIGMFLIYNAMTFSVIQRRVLIGNLRALGVTRWQVFVLVLVEACLIGAVGTLAGVMLGMALATELVRLVSRTINDLYFVVNVRESVVPAWVIGKAAAMGVGTALVASALPAWEATRVTPSVAFTRSSIESRAHGVAPRAAAIGAVVIAASVLLGALPGRSLVLGFGALFGLVLGFSLAVPALTQVLVRATRPLAAAFSGSLGPLAVQGVSASLSRTAVAIAALMVALSASVGVGVMVDSFRRAVSEWLELTLQADIYASIPEAGTATIDPDIVARFEAMPDVAFVSKGRSVTTYGPDGETQVVAIRMAPQSYRGFRFLEGEPEAAWAAFDDAQAVLVTEPLGWRRRVQVGGSLTLSTARGAHAFRVAGVVRDYGSERGAVIMSRDTFDAFWDEPGYSTLGIYTRDGISPAAVLPALRAALGDAQDLRIRANSAIRAASLAVFDRTFTITVVLRILTTIVAFVGILSALMALQMERVKEVAVLRALGLTQRQVWGVVVAQTGLMGAIAGGLSLPLGIGMAVMLIRIINRRSFGWSMDMHVDPVLLGQALILGLAAALIAGFYPALKMTRTPPALALRED